MLEKFDSVQYAAYILNWTMDRAQFNQYLWNLIKMCMLKRTRVSNLMKEFRVVFNGKKYTDLAEIDTIWKVPK